jgi:NADH-quinone oxidoreductase subunit N
VMVSISRPLPVAQEAGVKYFFLGAMSAAIMLFGFSYLYGTTGLHDLRAITDLLQRDAAGQVSLSVWQMLAFVVILLGLAFKIAAFPLHFYAADVYQGAATPVTAFLAFVPKTTGFVAIIKILAVVGGDAWIAPRTLVTLLMVLAVLTMTIGNVLGLLQYNVKRVLAYSSIAHSGYMLVGLTALLYAAHNPELSAAQRSAVQVDALKGVLFYLAAYGIMNAGSFGVLMLLPTRDPAAADNNAWAGSSAETFEDIAGTGQAHPALGLAMAVSCLSLTGLPLTIGFFGKFYLIKPALDAKLIGLAILLVINAAISAAYYLRIVAAMFLRPEPAPLSTGGEPAPASVPAARVMPMPIALSVGLSVAGTLLLGLYPPAIEALSTRTSEASFSNTSLIMHRNMLDD